MSDNSFFEPDIDGESLRIDQAREDYSTSTGFLAFSVLVVISFMFSIIDMDQYETWTVVYLYTIHVVLFAATMFGVVTMFVKACKVIPPTKDFIIIVTLELAAVAFVAVLLLS